MKKFIRALFVAVLLCGSLFVVNTQTVEAEEAFDILSHDVTMTVNEDGSLEVTETMELHFTSRRHGIYVTIPTDYTIEWNDDGNIFTKDYHFPVSNVSVDSSHEYATANVSGGIRIQIGDEDEYANEYETYIFSYTIHTKDLDLDGTQMLFVNIITNGWDADTDEASFTINLPKSIAGCEVYTSTPQNNILSGSGEMDGLVVTVSDTKIEGYTTTPMSSSQTITLQVMLPDDYFQFDNPDTFGLVASGIAVVFGAAVAIVFWIFGRDEPLIQTVEFHAPKGMTSAEVGYVIDEMVDDNDLVSLILDWGRRGIITIEEKEDDLYLTKVKDIEATAPDYEKNMFDSVFANGDYVATSSFKDSFYRTLEASRKLLQQYFNGERSLSTPISVALQYTFAVIGALPSVVMAGLAAYAYSYSAGMTLVICCIVGFCWIAVGLLIVWLYQKRYLKRTGQKNAGYVITAVLGLAAEIFIYVSCYLAEMNLMYPTVVLIMQILVEMFVCYMRKRTPYGNEMLGKILGLREFIVVAQQDRLQVMLEENPYYFYDILPFAYALGLTEQWTEHFKNLVIEPCDWYYSYYPYHTCYESMRSLETQMHSVSANMSSTPASSSSSDGGSFSGGGGFGGSSGGSW